jgi:hypothetical protein
VIRGVARLDGIPTQRVGTRGTLDGKLNSEIEADLVRQITRNTKGVVDIEDRLTVTKK